MREFCEMGEYKRIYENNLSVEKQKIVINNVEIDFEELLKHHGENSVEAIRELRAATGITLKEATKILDDYKKGILIDTPQKEELKTLTKSDSKVIELFQKFGILALMVLIYPIGVYFLWKNKKFDKQFKVIESICCFGLWIVLIAVTAGKINTIVKPDDKPVVQVTEEQDENKKLEVVAETLKGDMKINDSSRNVLFTTDDLKSVKKSTVKEDGKEIYAINMFFTDDSAERLQEVMESKLGEELEIYVDGQCMDSQVVPITVSDGYVQITGFHAPSKVSEIVDAIKNGSDNKEYQASEDTSSSQKETTTPKKEEQTDEESKSEITEEQETDKNEVENSKAENSEIPDQQVVETDSTTEKLEVSSLFEEIYFPYAKREKPFIFEAVKTFAENLDHYTIEIQEPNEEDAGIIQISAENGDYVFFAFAPNTAGIHMIMTLSYHQAATNSEVSLNNYSPDCTPEYDTFKTHIIGESEMEVKNVDEQQSFLFQK